MRGGPTSLGNAQGLCQACNLAKSLPGWRSAPVGECNGPPIAAVVTPTGHVYSSAGSGRYGPLP
ncbi:hypothetical protein [Nocardioides astragali]|uniref:HNH endonuclease n=1 Tax=Nocardioides astragali TaxID=1776736 RepID=A0ABW2N5W1_9ACTN|nr:hypothetical protein [Nocardioides astragali]